MLARTRLRTLLGALVALAVFAVPAAASERPPMRHERLAYWPERVALTQSWSQFMYGTEEFEPRLIVEHWTDGTTQDGAIDFWNLTPESTWVHFIVDPDGRITQLAPLDVIAKQAFGVSPWAIGVEHVGRSDGEVMGNAAERRASYRLTCWLQERFRIPLRGVIGHGEAPSNPRFGFTPEGWRWIEETGYRFHEDFSHATMARYRSHLRAAC
ncbi:MAG TPA: N-acetylmuramoyl-L-alanine amidase [Solirubrobacterales bacterium]|nr:N-acetylmuramoyl-L-alanine amidase [Solirubrobacterales bacterium]